MINNFTAIDFETAQGKRWSICQVGLVRVENGMVKEKFSILVQPPDNMFLPINTQIHGITPDMTKHAPRFDKVWPKLMPFIKNQNVVAHNGFSFDFPCLSQTLNYYGISTPEFTGHCTYKIYKENLALLCRKYNIILNHHDALSDAMACAKLFQNHFNITN